MANVVFATTQGTLGSASTTSVSVVGGATFTSPSAGVASIKLMDPSNPTVSTDMLTVAVTPAATSAATITLQAAPSVVAISVLSEGGTSSTSSLIATVKDGSGNPVGGAVIAFQIVVGTGTAGGELISPVVQLTNTTAGSGFCDRVRC